MGQINRYFRSIEGGSIAHWCPACHTLHYFPKKPLENGAKWSFNNNFENATFTPSMHITVEAFIDDDGTILCPKEVCHYNLTNHHLIYCGDCTHDLRGKTVSLPELPAHCRDIVI